MKTKLYLIATVLVALSLTACNDDDSYSDLLNIENHASNMFLSNYRIVNEVPADSVFEVGPQAPFYRIDPDGFVYMQVLNAGDRKNDRAKTSESIYFRYTRYNLIYWMNNGTLVAYDGNADDMSYSATYFNYNDYTLPVSSQWGYGIQMPLNFLGVECEVNLVIKSQYGMQSEISYVQPFLYRVRYYHSKI